MSAVTSAMAAYGVNELGFWTRLGCDLASVGRFAEAADSFQRAIAIAPDDARTHQSLGMAFRPQGRLADAIASFRRAVELDPADAGAVHHLAAALKENGQPSGAAAVLSSALGRVADSASLHTELAIILAKQADHAAAERHFRRAAEIDPGNPTALNNLGTALKSAGRLNEAIDLYRQAIALRHDYPQAHNNLGVALAVQGLPREASLCFEAAIALKPDFSDARRNHRAALLSLRQYDDAISDCRRALTLHPTSADAAYDLAVCMATVDQEDEAIELYRLAISLSPGHSGAHFGLAEMLLKKGEFRSGWEEYEWRKRLPGWGCSDLPDSNPEWLGEPGLGRTLLVRAEQGFGDTLQFCRFASHASSRGFSVVVQAPRALARLLKSLNDVSAVIDEGEQPPVFDLHCSMASLPFILQATLHDITGQRYLRPDAGLVDRWRARMMSAPVSGLRVGLTWAGNAALGDNDHRRSMPFDHVRPLLDLPGVTFFCLQKDRRDPLAGSPVIDFMDEVSDFADTAGLMENLDLVIAVDTAVAHLAGALGKPVWLMNRFDSDWRWLRHRADSPWYESMRIYRQPRLGEWQEVVDAVRRDLAACVHDRCAGGARVGH